jgi:methylated-DNA-[protein]-cysteine S-methyltransferase
MPHRGKWIGLPGRRSEGGPRAERPAPVVASADGPFGPARIAAGANGLIALELLSSAEAFEAHLARRGFPRPVPLADALTGPAGDLAHDARMRVAAFLAGEPVPLDDLPVDLSDRSDWDRLVLEAVRAIPRGEVAGYGEVARRIGRTGAARAVGGAVGRNPVGLVIPCHRVIAGDGSLGGFGVAAWGGREAALDLKGHLLELEGVRIARRSP